MIRCRPPTRHDTAGRVAIAAIGAALAIAALAGCGSADSGQRPTSAPAAATADAPSTVPAAPRRSSPLDDVTATVVITRQRDLIDRGFVNVMTHNGSSVDVLLVERRLVTDGLDAPVVADREIKVGAGRTVAVQTPYGTAIRCDDTAPLDATFAVDYRTGSGTEVHHAAIPLGGTDVLDGIRAERCAAAVLAESTTVQYVEALRTGESLQVVMRIELDDPNRSLVVGDARGTVLVAARRGDSGALALDSSRPRLDVPLVFTVNRCDPHALAEVTKKYGVDLDVSIDGGESVAVGFDVDPLVAELDDAVAACRERTGQ